LGLEVVLASLLAMGGAIASSGDCALAQIIDGTQWVQRKFSSPTPMVYPVTRLMVGGNEGANLFQQL